MDVVSRECSLDDQQRSQRLQLTHRAKAGAPRRVSCSHWLRSEEHTSELQSQSNLVCRLLLEKNKHPALFLPHTARDTAHRRGTPPGSRDRPACPAYIAACRQCTTAAPWLAGRTTVLCVAVRR